MINKTDKISLDFFPAISSPTKEDQKKILLVQKSLEERTCLGNKFLGWLDGPSLLKKEQTIFLQKLCRFSTVIVLGVGGSINGSRGIIELLQSRRNFLDARSFAKPNAHEQTAYKGNARTTSHDSNERKVFFADFGFDSSVYETLVFFMQKKQKELKNWALLIISKSGNTQEVQQGATILVNALHLLAEKENVPRAHGEDSPNITGNIFLLSDANARTKSNALWELAKENGWTCLASQEDIGGRFSTLSEIAWIPCSYCGIDVQNMREGALHMRELCSKEGKSLPDIMDNPALKFAWFRYNQMCRGKTVEAYSCQRYAGQALLEWIMQLFAESEGKNGQGVWPLRLRYSKDLHSVGQIMQEGPRNIFETQLILPNEKIDKRPSQIFPKKIKQALEELEKTNQRLTESVRLARISGQVPLAQIRLPDLSPAILGGLIYCMQYSCAISANLLGVNAFDQPGVEEYKKNI